MFVHEIAREVRNSYWPIEEDRKILLLSDRRAHLVYFKEILDSKNVCSSAVAAGPGILSINWRPTTFTSYFPITGVLLRSRPTNLRWVG